MILLLPYIPSPYAMVLSMKGTHGEGVMTLMAHGSSITKKISRP